MQHHAQQRVGSVWGCVRWCVWWRVCRTCCFVLSQNNAEENGTVGRVEVGMRVGNGEYVAQSSGVNKASEKRENAQEVSRVLQRKFQNASASPVEGELMFSRQKASRCARRAETVVLHKARMREQGGMQPGGQAYVRCLFARQPEEAAPRMAGVGTPESMSSSHVAGRHTGWNASSRHGTVYAVRWGQGAAVCRMYSGPRSERTRHATSDKQRLLTRRSGPRTKPEVGRVVQGVCNPAMCGGGACRWCVPEPAACVRRCVCVCVWCVVRRRACVVMCEACSPVNVR